MPILFSLEQIEVGATSNNIIDIILKTIYDFGGLTKVELGDKLVFWVVMET